MLKPMTPPENQKTWLLLNNTQYSCCS